MEIRALLRGVVLCCALLRCETHDSCAACCAVDACNHTLKMTCQSRVESSTVQYSFPLIVSSERQWDRSFETTGFTGVATRRYGLGGTIKMAINYLHKMQDRYSRGRKENMRPRIVKVFCFSDVYFYLITQVFTFSRKHLP